MSESIVRNIVETLIQDNWVLTDVDYENVKYIPRRGKPFISPLIVGQPSTKTGFNCYNKPYTVIIEVKVAKNTGLGFITDYTDRLVDLFQGYSEGNFYCLKAHVETIGNVKQWYQRNVICTCKFKQVA